MPFGDFPPSLDYFLDSNPEHYQHENYVLELLLPTARWTENDQ